MFQLDTDFFLVAVASFLRIGAILFVLPIFGDNPTPVRVRILLAGVLTIGIHNLIPTDWAKGVSIANLDVVGLGLVILREMLIGVTIGYVSRLAFDSIVMSASLVGYQMGFGTAGLMMPDLAHDMNAFTALHRVLFVLIFLLLDLHFMFIGALVDTFQFIPLGGAAIHGSLVHILIETTSGLFTTALQLAAPILIALLFAMAALGLLARAVPQLNVFTMSFTASFFLGLGIYIASAPFFPEWVIQHFATARIHIYEAMQSLVKA